MYQKANMDIRAKAKAAGIPLWRVAEALGVSEPTIIRTLRHELPDTEKVQVLEIIAKLAGEVL